MPNTVSVHVLARNAVQQLVQNDSDLMDLTGGRIFPQSLAEFSVDADVAGLTFPRIHYRVVGGAVRGYPGKFHESNMIVQCWSKSGYAEAWDLAHNFKRVVHPETVDFGAGKAAVHFICTNSGQEVWDPTQQLYYIVQQYRVNIIDKT